MVIVAVGPELGNRSFTYLEPMTDNLRDFNSYGIPMARVRGELYPLAGLTTPLLKGLGLVASYGRSLSRESSTSDGESITTELSDYLVMARWQVTLESITLGLEGGIGNQRFRFTPNQSSPNLFSEVPDVDYHFQQYGAVFGVAPQGPWSLGLDGGYRRVSSIGTLQSRFAQTDVSSLTGAVDVAYAFSPTWALEFRGNYTRYELTFANTSGAPYQASGAVERIFGVSLNLVGRL